MLSLSDGGTARPPSVLKTIDAVNLILRTAGHQSVSSVTASDTRSNTALATLVRTRQRILEKAYQFNKLVVDLNVNSDDRVTIPEVYLSIKLPFDYLTERLDTNDDNLYVWNNMLKAWHTDKVMDVVVAIDVTNFDKIPDVFQTWIAYEAAMEYQSEHKGNPTAFVTKRAQDARADALNSLPASSINESTGWSGLKAAILGDGI